MTMDEAKEILQAVKFLLPIEAYSDMAEEALDIAIEALEQPIPKPHDRLMFWETARRIIDSPRSKSQMLAVLDSVPPVEALERKHGIWMPIERGDKGYSAGDFICSCCGKPNKCYSVTDYCCSCGAEMKND